LPLFVCWVHLYVFQPGRSLRHPMLWNALFLYWILLRKRDCILMNKLIYLWLTPFVDVGIV
jgi:hypothetical protein